MTYGDNHSSCKNYKENNDFIEYKPRSNEPKDIILSCGQGSSMTFNSSNDLETQLAHVSIDLSCLKKSKVLIEFSSLVNYFVSGSGIQIQIMYELFRVCAGNGEPLSLGTWIFERTDKLNATANGAQTVVFNFNFCDYVKCPGCCQYFVNVKPIQILIGGLPLVVDNARITAIAQSL